MKTIILTLVTIAGLLAFCSCTTVKEQQPTTHTSSSTTESSSVQPVATETQTVRSY